MTRIPTRCAVSLVSALLGCSAAPAPAPAVPSAPLPIATALPPPPATAPPAATKPEPEPPAKPAPVERSGKVWPFHRWDRAAVVTFNQFAMRPRTQLRAYDDNGWSPNLVDRKPLDEAHAREAVELVMRTRGGVEVSKCPFPRHAVILYEGELPVASINVCFECGDILLWPRWEPEPRWDELTKKQRIDLELRYEKQLELYDEVFPRWKTFFRDDMGMPIDAPYAKSTK